MDELKFGDEIEPVVRYMDKKERKFIFMSWMGNDLKGYARIATIQTNGDGFDSQGRWVEGFGLVLEEDCFVHKNAIKKLGT